jgi:N-acetylglucosaminyl-diphospho-decaprenol L-rhamnosyltransferase
VIIVTWNSAAEIAGCLASLPDEIEGLVVEVLVVDNASTDDTVAIARQARPRTRVIENATNRGLAAANNQGMVEAGGELLLISNPDVVFRPGAVEAMVAAISRHERAGWLIPLFLYEDGAPQTSVGNLPRLGETLLGRQMVRRRSQAPTEGFWWDGWDHDTERPVGRGLESAYVVRRQAVHDVGLQNERYVLDWEGFDWSERFHRAGWEIWFTPAAEVVHLGGMSRRQVPFRAVITQHKGMYRYFADRGPALRKPLLAGAFGCRALVKLALTATGVPLYSWAHRIRSDSPTAPSPLRTAPPAPLDD